MTNQEIKTRGELIRDEIVTGANTAQRVGEAFVAIGENLDEVEKRNEPIAFTESKAMNSFIKTLYIDVSGYNGNAEILNLWAYYFNNGSGTIYISIFNSATGGSAIIEFFPIANGDGRYCKTFANGVYLYLEIDETQLPPTSISQRGKLTPWAYANAFDPRILLQGVTENPIANKFIKSLYIDLSQYTGNISDFKDSIRLYGFWNKQSLETQYYLGVINSDGTGAVQIYSSNTKPESLLSKSYTITGKGSVTIHAKVDWDSLSGISTAYATCRIKFNPVVFDKNFFYAQLEPSGDSELVEDKFFKKLNSKVFTESPSANKVIRKLYIDTSGYTGNYSLSGIHASMLVKNVSNVYGIQLRNSNGDLLGNNFWLNKNDSQDQTEEGIKKYLSKQSLTKGGIFVYAEYNWDNMSDGRITDFELTPEAFNPINDPRKSVGLENLNDALVELIAGIGSGGNVKTPLTGGVYGCIGDSITEGAGVSTYLDSNDPYKPISGTSKPTYGYYIAKTNDMYWRNYGISGSTLGDVTANGVSRNGFAKANGRYTQLASNLTHISIFFGWNDHAYGNVMKREDWLLQNYGTKIYYPLSSSLIGTTHTDGTPYTTQEQYDACNAVTGTVNGVTYNNSAEYWKALYIGSPNDNTPDTFWGAWNVVLQYLINNYPLAKILLIVPYLSSNGNSAQLLQETVRKAAHKYGLCVYDFNKKDGQLFAYGWYNEDTVSGTINNSPIRTVRGNSLLYDGTHPNEDGYKYMYPSINAKLLSL